VGKHISIGVERGKREGKWKLPSQFLFNQEGEFLYAQDKEVRKAKRPWGRNL